DDRYFTDTYQAMPLHGYTKMFGSILNHEKIQVETGVDFSEMKFDYAAHHVVYTGPIDEYFNFCFGKLPYRSLRFEQEHLPNTDYM
uniref:UDP-galactopyranose mutase n=1 Tax=Pseudomonas aeruginosa TaxID=287 RepID=UPI0039C41390